eukprot:1190126-Prorocentrum_minimum.AAC.19
MVEQVYSDRGLSGLFGGGAGTHCGGGHVELRGVDAMVAQVGEGARVAHAVLPEATAPPLPARHLRQATRQGHPHLHPHRPPACLVA